MAFTTTAVNSSQGPEPLALMAAERAKASFDPQDMFPIIEGTPKKANKILQIYQSLERDPILAPSFKDYELSRSENREQTTTRIARMTQYVEQELYPDFWRRANLVTAYDPSLGIRIAVNLGLFIHCIKGNGTDAQYHYWCIEKEAKYMKQLWGCFGMTELGHGSNAAGVETTATFDKENDEFVINTPHIGATKWWIGGAAHSATHSSVYARLIVKGKDWGVKTFVVPLRDSNHQLMPGVSIGDIGAKMGREGVDNGWIQFSSVRIPRAFMLQKYCKVSRSGEVTLPPLEQLSYISLLQGRVAMASDSYRICARFITIATRYAVGRRQFKSDLAQQGEETQLIDYPLHQRRLMPILALTYLAGLATDCLECQHESVVEDLEAAVQRHDKKAIEKSLGDTKSLFVDSASLKFTLTWLAEQSITESRQACGGLGYSSYSGFGKAYADWVVQCTWEGDNNVLGMSAGRTIIKNVEDVLKKSAHINGTLLFLNNAPKQIGSDVVLKTEADLTPANVLWALETLIVRVTATALKKRNEANSWDLISYERVLLSKLRCHQYMLLTCIDSVSRITKPELLYVLVRIMRLYALTHLLENFSREFVNYLVLCPKLSLDISNRLIGERCLQVREQAITLTDAFQIPDTLLNSAIGGYDGNWYETYFRVVKTQNDVTQTKAPYSLDLEAMLNRVSTDARGRLERSPESIKKLSLE